MQYLPQYFVYEELVTTGQQIIRTEEINKENIYTHFYAILDILKDGIETEEVRSMRVTVVFCDGISIKLTITKYLINLLLWRLVALSDGKIYSVHLFYPNDVTAGKLKEYVDNIYVNKYRKRHDIIQLNQTIDAPIGGFRDLKCLQLWLANSLNFKDTIDLMKKYPDFRASINFDITNIPLEDIKEEGMKATELQINYIKNSDHCLRDSFRTGEAINKKQYKEVAVNVGTKPDGQGGIFPHPITTSMMNGGLKNPEEYCIDSSIGRIAQMLQKNNVGESGAFARNLELNNQDTYLHPDPDYVCNSQNFQTVYVDSEEKLRILDLRYYRDNPKGIDKLLKYEECRFLIGRTIYLRSPMTCNSAAHGRGVCYRCYGDLAYTNREINIGQIAAEELSSKFTQTLLSAKHLLESKVIKMDWPSLFYELFSLTFNTIALKSDIIVRDWKIIIDEDIQTEEDIDEVVYNYYVYSFIIQDNEGNQTRIQTSNLNNIYFIPEVYDYMTNPKNKGVELDEEGNIIVDLVSLMDFDAIFMVEIKNNELSQTMTRIKKLIDNKTVMSNYDRNSILEEFIATNLAGGININSVHFEILLMNQIRALDDDLDKPRWDIPNVGYQIFTLDKSLNNNRSITVRLESNKITKVLLNPDNQRLNKPAIMDMFFMESPQNYIDPGFISDDYKIENEEEESQIEPLVFSNPKIQSGRFRKKSKEYSGDDSFGGIRS